MLIPKDNEKDLAEIPDNVKTGLEIIPVATVDEVVSRALTRPMTPVVWTDEDELAEDRRAPREPTTARARAPTKARIFRPFRTATCLRVRADCF